mgnify:CR=1 FL=1
MCIRDSNNTLLMVQKLTILLDLDGTLIDTAPDLMNAHNHVMKKFGYETKSVDDIRKLVGKGAASLISRSVWSQAKKEFGEMYLAGLGKQLMQKESYQAAKKYCCYTNQMERRC